MFSAISGASIVLLSLILFIGVGAAGITDIPKIRGEKVGIIEITGTIVNSKETLRQIKQFREDDDIKAIVIRIDSPGGGVGPSQEIFREVRKTISQKKVVASMGAVAASGGYYIAAGADGIMANPGTITGSIGVIIGYTNFEALFQKIGLTAVVIKSGEFKDIGSPARQMTDNEKKLLQEFVDKTRIQFVRDVSEGRGKPTEDIERFADGRILSGEEAKASGLVDRLGNLDDAVEWAGRMGGITGRIVPVYAQRDQLPLLHYLTNSLINLLYRGLTEPFMRVSYL